MSRECRARAVLTPKRPYALLHWDFTGGWFIAHTSRTRAGAWRGWEFLKGKDAVVVKVLGRPTPEPCDCDDHKRRRKHFHPCPECQRPKACGEFPCRKSKAPKYICRRCSWKRDFGKPPTEAEIKRYGMDEDDASPVR